MSENEIPAEEKSLLQEGLDALRKGESEDAEEVFQEFLSRYPESKLADKACYNLASICLKKEENEKALEWLEFLLRKYPNGETAYMAKDERIEVQRMLGIGPIETSDERYRKGKEAISKGKLIEAEKIFLSYLNDYQDSELVDNAHFNLAMIYKSLGKMDMAKYHVDIIMSCFPDSDAAVYAADLLTDDE